MLATITDFASKCVFFTLTEGCWWSNATTNSDIYLTNDSDGGVGLRVFSLLSASVVKGGLTILTFGLAIPAGIFMPSMVIGALFGRALGMLVQAWQQNHPGFWLFASCLSDEPCVTPGSYAMVGAAAFMGGVTRMTVSLVIIMFELTGALTYVLPIMIVGKKPACRILDFTFCLWYIP